MANLAPDADLINFDSPRPPTVPEIKTVPPSEDDEGKENCSGIGNDVVYLDSTFSLTEHSRKSVGNDSSNGQTLIDLTPAFQKNEDNGHQTDSNFSQADASYAALKISPVDISATKTPEKSLHESQPEIDSVNCSNGEFSEDMSRDVSCSDPLDVGPAESPIEERSEEQTEDENEALHRSSCEVEDMELDDTIVDQSICVNMSVAFEESADLDISNINFQSFTKRTTEMEKEIEKLHVQSQDEKQSLREKEKNIINLNKYYEASCEDLQYLFWQKAILDDEFEKNNELAARDIATVEYRTEKIQQQININEELSFENSQLKVMQARVKLLIDLLHKKDEKISALNEDITGLNQGMSQIKKNAAEEREKLGEENRNLVKETALLKNRQVEKQVENQNLLRELQELRIAHESDLEKLNALMEDKRETDESKAQNEKLVKELEELRVARENDLAALKTEMDEKIKAEESKAFNYYVALKQYEENWISFHEKYEHIHKTNRKMSDDLGILEVAFKNVVDKFEKSKSLIEGYKSNEAIYEENIKKYKAKLEEEYERYKSLKNHATERFEEGNKKYLEIKVNGDNQVKKQSAIIRRLEIKLSATEDLLLQKNTECDRLAKLCDEVTGSV